MSKKVIAGYKSTTQLAEEVPWRWDARESPTDWVRNFIYKHDLPYSRWRKRFIYLDDEQEDEFWRAIELYRLGFLR